MANASEAVPNAELWPELPYAEWQPTLDTLHMWTQIVGKTRLLLEPMQNHWWQVPLYASPHGLNTSAIPYGAMTFDAEFDFLNDKLMLRTSTGLDRVVALYPRSVADFYAEYMSTLKSLGIEIELNTMPMEFADPIPFESDTKHASYDKKYVTRFWRILLNCDEILKEFRSGFLGKCSPVHFFWGSFDMAVSRFSGRLAPVKKDANRIESEAYSHEVSSCGFWPGDVRFPHPAFYSYIVPAPAGLDKERVKPDAASYVPEMGEFILKYDDLRKSEDPKHSLLEFCQSTYDAEANLAGWDRAALERQPEPEAKDKKTGTPGAVA
jgi:hypothetical protein